jgi:deoxyadenosine/deoxycytidine kinase/NTP pyrophosphatase (non-canonical NTP hydrolase)
MRRHPYIAIEGVIGVGKTTLARQLQSELDAQIILEVFEENPFLSDFYADRDRYAFQTQIFFLLSRYRQQLSTVPEALRRGITVSDYIFAKDSLFAHVNLRGDELSVYDRVHDALGEHIPNPDLLVYLRADTDVLMRRIAIRDRPYERNMDPMYIEGLRLAYEAFVADYDQGALLVIDTNSLDFVLNPDDGEMIKERIKSALALGNYQATLPGVESVPLREPHAMLDDLAQGPHRLADFQRFHLSLDAQKGFEPDVLFNFAGLAEEIGELARELQLLWMRQAELEREGLEPERARAQALSGRRDRLRDELADSLAYLLKLSNYAGIDLEDAYLEKMALDARRGWGDSRMNEESK